MPLRDFLEKQNVQVPTQKTVTQPVKQTATAKPIQPEKQSLFRWLGKQLMKPVGVASEELEGLGDFIGNVISIASPKVTAKQGLTRAFEAGSKAQEEALKVITGKKETSFSQKFQERGLNTPLDKAFGIGADLFVDPLNFNVGLLAKAARVTRLKEIVSPAVKVIKESPAVQKLTSFFSNTTGNKAFDAVVNKFRNLREYREGQLLDSAVLLQKDIQKMSKGADEAITEGLENPQVFNTLPTNLKSTVIALKSTYKELLDEAKKVGLSIGEIQYYAPHIRTKESFLNKVKQTFGLGAKEWSTAGVEKGRKLQGTIKELGEAGIDIFEKNPAIQLAKKGQMYAKAITSKEFAAEVAKFAIDKGVEVTNPLLKGKKFLPQHAAVIDNFYAGIKPPELKVIFKAFDEVQNLWKAQVLVSPSYHIRNIAGNLWNNYLANINPFFYAQAAKIQNSKKYLDLIDEAKKVGVLNEGWYAADIADEITKRISAVGNIKKTFNPLSRENWLLRLNRRVGIAVENNARLAHYLSKRSLGFTPEEAALSVKKYLFDYKDLTSFEKNVLKRAIPFYCVPISHEILTQGGWKYYNELKIGEKVLTYNIQTEALEWQKLDNIALFDFNGVLKRFERRGGKVLFTDDHRWATTEMKTFVKLNKWYGGERKIKKTFELKTSDLIPLTGNYNNDNSILTPREAAILGWVVGDGYSRWKGNYCEMVVYQSPKKYLKKVIDLLGTKPRKPHPKTGVVCVPVAKKDVKEIVKYYKDKSSLKNIIGLLSKEAILAIWEALFLAEGFTDEGTQGFAQDPIKNKEVLDCFQILTILIGKTGNLSSKGMYIKNSKYLYVKEGIGEEYYIGKIWCPKTKNGTWIMRNNGFPIITGNTWTRKNLPLQLEALITQPQKVVLPVKIIKQIESGTKRPDEKYMGAYIEDNIPVRIRQNEQGNTEYFLLGQWLPYAQAIDVLSQPLNVLTEMVTPLVKTPLEYFSNKSLYFKDTFGKPAPIERRFKQQGEFLGQSMRKKNILLLRNIRVLNDMNKWIDKQDPDAVKDSWVVKLLNTLFGKTATYDVQKAKFFYNLDTKDHIDDLRKAIKDADRRGYKAKANELRQELKDVIQERK